jgi:hypothetical protein
MFSSYPVFIIGAEPALNYLSKFRRPPQIPQFFIGLESPKDAWVIELGTMEKDIGREHSKGKVQGNRIL